MGGWGSTGIQMGAFEATVKYAQERLEFGRPIVSFEMVEDLLAKMLANLTACQCLMLRLATLDDEGKLGDHHAALAKAFCTAKSRETVSWGREVLGGNGIVADYNVARFFADAEALYSYEGTYQMQNLIVGKAIIAGADISELANVDDYDAEESSRFGQGVLDLIENLDKPVIAAINGFALGGGCETAMACTIRIAVEHAKFGQPEVKLGLLPGGGGTQRLPRLVGKGRALQLILTGETISAQEAYRIGLVNELLPAAGLIARAEAILKTIASNAPIAVRLSLEAADKGAETSQSEGQLLEASYFGLCAATEDKKEGTSAFLERRAPRFQGR